MNADLVHELRAAINARDIARAKRAAKQTQLAETKKEIHELNGEVGKLESTVESIQHELLTGESGLPLVDAAKANGRADERPGNRSPANFFGKRTRGASH
jgi:septal ring factor EnvC (AmiA/AmiB activator)